MSECRLVLAEIDARLSSGNVRQRLGLLQQVTDLFVAGSHQHSGAEIELFDDVLLRLMAEIETEARKRLSGRLAPLSNAPPKTVRTLAFDDDIEVARPVLTHSTQLSDADLVANAKAKTQDHLYAIAQRIKLSEAVTDVLVDRGDRRVVRCVAGNAGARFSLAGYGRVVDRAKRDRRLALIVAERSDIPHQCFLKLLATASAEVRRKLEAMAPAAGLAIRHTIDELATEKQREARESLPDYPRSVRDFRRLFRAHRLSETNVHAPASEQHFHRTVIALSMLGLLPMELVERALLDKGTDMILILAKAAGCSWATTKAMLVMDAPGRALSKQQLENACRSYEALSQDTARRVVRFYQRRGQTFARAPEKESVVSQS